MATNRSRPQSNHSRAMTIPGEQVNPFSRTIETYPPDEPGMVEIRSIAVGVDGSAQSLQAFDWAVSLAKLASASLTVVAVIPVHRAYAAQPRSPVEASVEDRRYMNEILARHKKAAESAGVIRVDRMLLEGTVVDELLGFLDDRQPDLMVMGARGLFRGPTLVRGERERGGTPSGPLLDPNRPTSPSGQTRRPEQHGTASSPS